MAKHRYATIWYGSEDRWFVFFSDSREKMDSCHHDLRSEFKTEQEAVDCAYKWIKPKQGKINLLSGTHLRPVWTPIKG